MSRFCAVLAGLLAALAVRASDAPPPVIVDFFYEPGCVECRQVREEVLPVLASRFEGFYRLDEHDVGVVSNMALLVAYQQRLEMGKRNEPVSMVVDYAHAFAGVRAIREGVAERVERSIEERLAPGWAPPEPIRAEGGAGAAAERAGAFTALAVAGAGLADGINPCAISTLVFFMSLLAVARVRGRGLLAMGLSFCLASFLVYLALGFGLLGVIHKLNAFPAIRLLVGRVMLTLLGVLAFLSFRDAWRFHRSGRAGDVTLQLPDGLKRRIHGVMRDRLKTGSLLLGGFVIGASVTALESVCTGQLYLPTLVVVLHLGLGRARELGLLLLYNVMFVTPLAVVFALVYQGLKTERLLDWSRRNVVPSKVALGLLFLAMMAGLFWL